jgi:hypothetical protein
MKSKTKLIDLLNYTHMNNFERPKSRFNIMWIFLIVLGIVLALSLISSKAHAQKIPDTIQIHLIKSDFDKPMYNISTNCPLHRAIKRRNLKISEEFSVMMDFVYFGSKLEFEYYPFEKGDYIKYEIRAEKHVSDFCTTYHTYSEYYDYYLVGYSMLDYLEDEQKAYFYWDTRPNDWIIREVILLKHKPKKK